MLKLAIEKGVILSVVILIVCLFGVIAIYRVPVQMIPDMDTRVISVKTHWPGATPQDIEKEIIIEQETYLTKVPNLQKMTSLATMSNASIDLEFTLGTNIQEAMLRVNNALTQVSSYPENVDQPRLISASSSLDPFIFYAVNSLAGAPSDRDVQTMKDFLNDEVASVLERVQGVSQATFYGGTSRQIKIEIDPAELAQRQISISELHTAIRSRNRDISAGDIDSGKRRYIVRTIGRYQDVEDIANTVIAERNGIKTRLRDIGKVSLGFNELKNRAYINGEEMFMIVIRREMGANVIDVLAGVKEAVAQLNKSVLKDAHLYLNWVADDVGYVKNAIYVVGKNLALGAVLSCFILLLFFRRLVPTLLGTIGVPICTVGAFLGLLIFNRSLNVISLAGIAFAIGMTLDNSIVVLENILRHRNMGKDKFSAALDGVQEVWKAVLASTLTTVFVFLPIVLIQEEAGQLYSDIAIAISSAIVMSMLLSITLIPSSCSRLSDQASQLADLNGTGYFSFLYSYALSLQEAIINFNYWLMQSVTRRVTFIFTILSIAVLIIFEMTPRAEYLPEGEEPKIFAFMIPPSSYNLAETDAVGRTLDEAILPHVGKDKKTAAEKAEIDKLEGDFPSIRYFIRHSLPNRIFSVLEPSEPSPENIEKLKQSVSAVIGGKPGMISFVNKGSIFSGNTGGSRSVELNIQSADLDQLYNAAILSYLQTKKAIDKPQIRPIPGLSQGQAEIRISPDWDRLSELGIKNSDLGYAVWAMTDGAFLDEYFLDDDKIDIYLYSLPGLITQPEDIEQLPIYTGFGDIVPLSSIAEISEVVSAETIRRVDGKRTVTLSIVPPVSMPLEQAVEIVERDVIAQLQDSGAIAGNVDLRIGGASDKLKATRKALGGNLLIAIVLSYLLMVAIFSHWGFPLIILLNLPLGVSGGIFGLWLMNNVFGINVPFDMITMLGMIVLTGTVVNNPILLVEQTREFLKAGMSPAQAVIESSRTRLKPIMMSMLTTIFGLSPVVFLPGAGTELYRGLGCIVLFGLFFSTLITLTFTPALLSLVLEFSEKHFPNFSTNKAV